MLRPLLHPDLFVEENKMVVARKPSAAGRRIIIAPNAFKGSLSAVKAAEAIARGVGAVLTGWDLVQIPLADGGDGTTECIIRATGGRIIRKRVTGPLGEPVEGYWGLTGDGSTAVVEVSAASGLALAPQNRLDPLRATSYGTGELILEALHSGCDTLFIGLGGSATNDAGAGLLQALGFQLTDRQGRNIGRGAASLADLHCINAASGEPRLREVELLAGCDVDNPLYGPQGAAYVYAPQKGAAPEQLPLLDNLLRRFAAVVKKDLGREINRVPGAGAAGGIGAAAVGVLGAALVPGVKKIMEITGLPALLEDGGTALVITGEGEINHQSLSGKVPVGVSRLAHKYGVPVLVLAGSLKLQPDQAREAGISAMFSITDGPLPLADAMERTAELLESTSHQAMLLFKLLPM